MQKRRRDTTVDIMKGILILLVVMAHAQGPWHRLIYLFHMAVFFMISGYLWGDHNDVEILQFIKRKIISLYIPYVVCNILYLVWFFCMPMVFEREMCERTVSGIIYEIIKILLFRGRTSMSDPTWFLAVLFIVNVVYALIRKIMCRFILEDRKKYCLLTLSAVAALAIGYVFYLSDFNLFQIGTICSSYVAFHMGNMIRKVIQNHIVLEQNKLFHTCLAIVAGGGMLVLLRLSDTEIRLITNTIVNPIYYCLGMLLGWIVVRYVAVILDRFRVSRDIFSYLGRHSMIILCAHFAAFRMIAVIQCICLNLPLRHVSDFPVVETEGYWWCAYLVVGIVVPLLIRYIFMIFKGRIMNHCNETK